MMTNRFDYESYFMELYRIAFGDDYEWFDVMQVLNAIEFRWDPSIKYDENRAEDGLQLRRDYLFTNGHAGDTQGIDDIPPSFFEVYVGLGKKMAHLLDRDLQTTMIYLLSIGPFESYFSYEEVVSVADCVMDRNYEYDGEGGLFPLRNPPRDQRLVELLYQLNLYVLDLELG